MERSIARARAGPLKKSTSSSKCGACRRQRTQATPLRLRQRAVILRAKENADKEGEEVQSEEPKLTLGGLAELVGLGMGVPVPAKVEIDVSRSLSFPFSLSLFLPSFLSGLFY